MSAVPDDLGHELRRVTPRLRSVAALPTVLILAALALVSCEELVVVPLQVETVEVTSGGIGTVSVGGSIQMSAVAKAGGRVLQGRTITWSSADPSVASVSGAGMVQALTPGTTEITARIEQRTGSSSITVANPSPVVTSINPTSVVAGSGALTLAVSGSNFTSSSRVRWNATELTTTYVSASELRASVLATHILSAGAKTITVVNPPPGGGISNGLTFTVGEPPNIGLNATSRSFTATEGGASPPAQSISITNAGGGTLSGLTVITSYSQGSGWLNVQLSSATAPATLTLQPTTGNLPAGTYNATVSIAAPGASNSPRTVAVALTVGQGPSIGLSSTTRSFTAAAGGANPAAQTVSITNTGGGTLSGLATGISYSQVGGWLNVQLSSETAPATLTIQPTTGILPAGTYNATVSVAAPGAGNSPQAVAVTLTIRVPVAPTISNIVHLGNELNHPSCASGPNPTRTDVRFTYSDPDGDVEPLVPVKVDWSFQSGNSGSYVSTVTRLGTGSSGIIEHAFCSTFGTSTTLTNVYSIQDSGGRQSNTLTVIIAKPPGAPDEIAASSAVQ